ncbi:MAG: GntR family transcriptional regulator [Pseudomonadota bacterium]|nr:GntR family transcriptional regulator [Pseudomonadota bacterium]
MALKIVRTVLEASDGLRLSDVAYTRILEVLFERKVAAGAYVSQGDLVELTGVSVGPLRDALRILEAEGVLTIHPRAGIEFVKPGLELTRATYQFRGIIEAAAVAVYAETADAAEMADLQRRHIKSIQVIEESGLTDTSLADLEELEQLLHNAIIASLRNPLIETSYRRIHNYLRLIRLDRKLTPPLALRSLREHLEIIEACQLRDPNKAEAALQTHFNAALRRHMGLY